MTWLLKLYPPRWRQRCGEEFLALVATQRFSWVTVLDIIGGALDAWTRPQSHLAARSAAQPAGDTIMLAKMLRLRCVGNGAKPTKADVSKGAGICLGGTMLSVLAATWMRRHDAEGMARTGAGGVRRRPSHAGCVADPWRLVDPQQVRHPDHASRLSWAKRRRVSW
jgi:hypothetical protein